MQLFDYVLYSLELHKVESEIRNQVKKYMQVFETETLVQDSFQEFISYLNPTLEYDVMTKVHLKAMN